MSITVRFLFTNLSGKDLERYQSDVFKASWVKSPPFKIANEAHCEFKCEGENPIATIGYKLDKSILFTVSVSYNLEEKNLKLVTVGSSGYRLTGEVMGAFPNFLVSASYKPPILEANEEAMTFNQPVS
jgi:hypothetical protein